VAWPDRLPQLIVPVLGLGLLTVRLIPVRMSSGRSRSSSS
jgi:hypothetical protein